MQDSFGNNRALPRTKFDCAAFEINQQFALDNIEKFVVVVMLVPVVFALHNTETNDRAVHPAEGLVIPLVLTRVGERPFVNYFQGLMKNVESSLIWEAFCVRHEVPPLVILDYYHQEMTALRGALPEGCVRQKSSGRPRQAPGPTNADVAQYDRIVL